MTTFTTIRRTAGAAASAALLATIVLVEPASAATRIGKNIGDELLALAKPVLLVLAAVMMMPMLVRRQASAVLVVAGLACVVGAFIFAPGAVQDVIVDFASSVAGK